MKILIVEDEKKIGNLLKFGLEQSGYSVSYVLDGETGLKRIEAKPKEYDLVVLDLMLPGKSGFEVSRDLREKNIQTPILVVSARSSLQDKIRALQSGANDYLVKPFLFRELLIKVKKLIRN